MPLFRNRTRTPPSPCRVTATCHPSNSGVLSENLGRAFQTVGRRIAGIGRPVNEQIAEMRRQAKSHRFRLRALRRSPPEPLHHRSRRAYRPIVACRWWANRLGSPLACIAHPQTGSRLRGGPLSPCSYPLWKVDNCQGCSPPQPHTSCAGTTGAFVR